MSGPALAHAGGTGWDEVLLLLPFPLLLIVLLVLYVF